MSLATRLTLGSVLVFAVAACGGGGGGSSPGPTPVPPPPAPANTAPLALNDSYSGIDQGATLSVSLAQGVLSNDSDANNDTLSAAVVRSTTNGSLSLTADGAFTYVHNGNGSTQDSFTYVANDGQANSSIATVTLTIAPVPAPANIPPTAAGICDNTPLDVTFNGDLSTSVSDPDSPTLRFSLASEGTKGSATVNPDGTFSYMPFAGERGIDTFTYRVDDLEGGIATETVMLIIGDTRIMPLGDSLTSGTESFGEPAVGSRIGYRKTLFERLINLGYAVDFVGSRQEGQDTGLADTDHEGHGGITTTGLVDGPAPGALPPGALLYTGIFQALENNPADVILLHIGTNDGPTPDFTELEVNRLLDEIDRWEDTGSNGNPVTVILARIINQNPINLDVTTVNNSVVQMAQNRISAGDNIIIVDQENALTYPADLADAVHPIPSGYNKMANVWLFPLAGMGTQSGTGTADQTGAHTGAGILPICN